MTDAQVERVLAMCDAIRRDRHREFMTVALTHPGVPDLDVIDGAMADSDDEWAELRAELGRQLREL